MPAVTLAPKPRPEQGFLVDVSLDADHRVGGRTVKRSHPDEGFAEAYKLSQEVAATKVDISEGTALTLGSKL